jgi:hypothetical protein
MFIDKGAYQVGILALARTLSLKNEDEDEENLYKMQQKEGCSSNIFQIRRI